MRTSLTLPALALLLTPALAPLSSAQEQDAPLWQLEPEEEQEDLPSLVPS